MDNQNTIEFCIAQNLAKALGFEKNDEIIWRLFLAMDIMGFGYNGLISNEYEIFNGLNGTCRDFVDRCFAFFNLSKQVADSLEHLSFDDENPLVLEVDDFYLSYHPYFNKYHHIRHVLLLGIQNDLGTIYDMGVYEMNLDIIKQAAAGAFLIDGNKDILSGIEVMTNSLAEYYENKKWGKGSGSAKKIAAFRKDLEENALSLKEGDFESLYYFVNKLGGPTQTRKFMHQALQSLHDSCGGTSKKLALTKDIIGELAYEWDILGNLFFKMSRSLKVEMHPRIFKRIDRILDLEGQLESL